MRFFKKNWMEPIVNEESSVLLFDDQLEKQILGSILIENRVFQHIELELQEDTFYFSENKQVLEVIKSLLQGNKQADEKTLFYSLENSDFPHQGGDLKQFITTLIDAGISLYTKPKDAVRILNHLALKRQLVGLQQAIGETIKTSGIDVVDEKIGDIERKLYSITNTNSSKDSDTQLKKYTEIVKQKLKKARESNKDIQGVKTGLMDLDQYTGGLQKSDLIIIAARPSMGKTALATTIAKNIATIIKKEAKSPEEVQGVAIFSLEMSGEQLATRMISMQSKYSTKTIHTARIDDKDLVTGEVIEKNKKISDKDWNNIMESINDIGDLPIYIDDTPALSISLLRTRARYLKHRYNICAIIIDYLQLLRASKNSGGNRVLEIAEITSTLKAIAKELEIPVVALSQLSRAVEGADRKDKRPQLSDLRESGTIEQDADIVMLLYREEYYLARKEPRITDPSNDMEVNEHAKWLQKYEKIKDLADVIVAKNRNGPVGTITLYFDREHMLFDSYVKDSTSQQYADNIRLQNNQNGQGQHFLANENNDNSNLPPSNDAVNVFGDAVENSADDEIDDELREMFK